MSVGIAPRHWAFVVHHDQPLPDGDFVDKGWLLYWFEEWTALPAAGLWTRERGTELLRCRFEQGRFGV